MFSDSISESVNLQNFLGGMPPNPPIFVCFAQHGHAFYYILDLSPPTSENVPTPLALAQLIGALLSVR